MTGMNVTRKQPDMVAPSAVPPDWREDPRELADSVQRRARRRRRSRVGAALTAVLVVIVGGWYLGFVTGWVSIPGLGTLTTHPADVSTFSVGDTTYLMQLDRQDEKAVVVSRQIGTSGPERLAGLPVPSANVVSLTAVSPAGTAHPAQSTYVAVFAAGTRDVRPEPNDPQSSVTVYEAVVRTTPTGSPLLGVVVTLNPPNGAPSALAQPGLKALHWTDADGHSQVRPVAP